MKDRSITRTIAEIAEHDVPANIDLWPRIRAQVRSERRSSSWARFVPATRLGWALLVLVLALTLGVGAVTRAAVPAVTRLFMEPPILDDPAKASLAKQLDLSETLDGVTVTLVQGYADTDRVVLGFTIESPEGERYDPAPPLTLTNSDGTELPWVHGYGAAGDSDIFGLSLPPGESAYAHVFDASALPDELASDTLALEFTMELSALPSPADAASQPADTPSRELAPEVVELAPLPPTQRVGPFNFRFSLPRP